MNGTVRIIGLLLLAAILAGCADVEPETAFDETVNVEGGGIYVYTLETQSDGITGHVEFEVLEGGDKDITFYILDDENMKKLKENLDKQLIENLETLSEDLDKMVNELETGEEVTEINTEAPAKDIAEGVTAINKREKQTASSMDYTLGPAGDYHFVFSNKHNPVTGKKVKLKVIYNPF